MKYLKPFLLLLLCALLLDQSAVSAKADQPPSRGDYVQFVGDQYVFVMLLPDIREDLIKDSIIRKYFSHSGIYTKTNLTNPIWTIDWYEFYFNVSISPDGQYMVVLRKEITDVNKAIVSFYKKGILIKEYHLADLQIDLNDLDRRGSFFRWSTERHISDDFGSVTLLSIDSRLFIFEIPTGTLIQDQPIALEWSNAVQNEDSRELYFLVSPIHPDVSDFVDVLLINAQFNKRNISTYKNKGFELNDFNLERKDLPIVDGGIQWFTNYVFVEFDDRDMLEIEVVSGERFYLDLVSGALVSDSEEMVYQDFFVYEEIIFRDERSAEVMNQLMLDGHLDVVETYQRNRMITTIVVGLIMLVVVPATMMWWWTKKMVNRPVDS